VSGTLSGTLSSSEQLTHLLRPAGAGLHTVSTGKAEQLALQRALYQVDDAALVPAAWRRSLQALASARVVVLGIPSDCGAGLVRGAAFGPAALRSALLRQPGRARLTGLAGVVDAGDVAVVPHLLHDDMLNEAQKQSCRQALYPTLGAEVAAALPVSPLSIAERALDCLFEINPGARLLVLGGDHSVAWPVVAALVRHRAPALGIVQPDAHTDLLPERLGVRYCFATWAYHANDLLGRNGRLVQVGVRASGRDKQHWESTLGVHQVWAAEVEQKGAAAVLDEIVQHLRARGVKQVYLSNDIDATDAGDAPSTGAPEHRGLHAEFILALIARLGAEFDLVAADLVEVAPPVGSPEDSRRTVELGARYLAASLDALLAGGRKLATT
jgi:arginase family enzyme